VLPGQPDPLVSIQTQLTQRRLLRAGRADSHHWLQVRAAQTQQIVVGAISGIFCDLWRETRKGLYCLVQVQLWLGSVKTTTADKRLVGAGRDVVSWSFSARGGS